MKLNALLKTLGFLALAATPVVAGTAPAPKNPIAPAPVNDDLGITASLGYDTNYVWRGLNYGQQWVRSAINGSILLIGGAAEDGAGSTSLTWDASYGSLAGDNDSFTPDYKRLGVTFPQANKQSFQRLTAGVGLEHNLGPAIINFGYTYINNMGALANGSLANSVFGGGVTNFGMNDIHNLGLGIKSALGPINLASSANFDIANGGWYFDATASSQITVTDSISIVPSASVGYGINYTYGMRRGMLTNAYSTGNGIDGFTAATFAINIPIKLNSRATLTPYIAVNCPLGALKQLGTNAGNNAAGFGTRYPSNAFNSVLFGGVTLSVRF